MKKTLTIILLSLALANSARPVIVGGTSLGYLTDSKKAYAATRLGFQFNTTSQVAQIGELEVGYTSDTGLVLVPITINYRAEFPINGQVGFYLGGGLGRASVKYDYSWYHLNTVPSHREWI